MFKEQLIKAQNLLLQDTWGKGAYFKIKNYKLCMCAHGALQIVVNPQVSRSFGRAKNNVEKMIQGANIDALGAAERAKMKIELDYIAASPHVNCWAAAEAAESSARKNAFIQSLDADEQRELCHKIWNERDQKFKEPDPKYGSLGAHYILGMVGLTSIFNDDKETTFDMIHNKYTLAIDVADFLNA